jgi:hypothetical protein
MFSHLILGLLLLAGEQQGRPVFEKNRGQAPADVRYLLNAGTYELQVKRGEIVFRSGGDSVRIQFEGHVNNPVPEGRARLDRLVRNINSTDDQAKEAIPTFASINYDSLYAGIDLACHGHGWQFQCDFVVLPGADPQQIRLAVYGADMATDETGGLIIAVGKRTIHLPKPKAFQLDHGQRIAVNASYKRIDPHEIGLVADEYKHSIPLIIEGVHSGSSSF